MISDVLLRLYACLGRHEMTVAGGDQTRIAPLPGGFPPVADRGLSILQRRWPPPLEGTSGQRQHDRLSVRHLRVS